MHKLKLFVSYCHKDVSADTNRLLVLVDRIENETRGTFDILVDYRHPDAAIGADLSAYMRQIDHADAILLLLSPTYKERVALRGSTGVYAEFKRIYDRLLAAEAANGHGRDFLLLPIVFLGTHETSCPVELQHLVAKDLTWLHVVPDRPKARRRSRSGSVPVRPQIAERLRLFVTELAERMAAVAHTRRKQYLESRSAMFRDFLLRDTKSRWDQPENKQYLDPLFVKTSVFLRARDADISFVVGRKGEGKSTLAHVLPAMLTPKPSGILRIEFDLLPFDVCYNILSTKPAEASDLRHAFSTLYSYQLLWDVFFHLFFAWVIRKQLPPRSHLRRLVRQLMRGLRADRDMGSVSKVLFVHTFEQLVTFLDLSMRSHSGTGGLADTVGTFAPAQFREFVLGRKGWATVEASLRSYDLESDRLLITADGFDVMIDYFRTATSDPVDAARFEREILMALLQVVMNSGPPNVAHSPLYKASQFCVAIPYDRFLEIRARHRDRYQFRHRFARLEWSGPELSSLIRKRLALLRHISDGKGANLHSRLVGVLRGGYPELPTDLAFVFNGRQYKLDLFCYVLRHTFWRPRDVLYLYAALLAAGQAFKKRQEPMPASFVRQVIAGATTPIVEDEFLQEFGTTFLNLQPIITKFRYGPQVLPWPDVRSRLDGTAFEIQTGKPLEQTLEWKTEVLFEIGFLGIVLDRNRAERLNSARHAFAFNEGHVLTEKLDRGDYSGLKFVVHPVFAEYLHLDTSKNDELILAMDWEYLQRNEQLRNLGPGS